MIYIIFIIIIYKNMKKIESKINWEKNSHFATWDPNLILYIFLIVDTFQKKQIIKIIMVLLDHNNYYIWNRDEKCFKTIYINHNFVLAFSFNVGIYKRVERNNFYYHIVSMSVIKNKQKYVHSNARELEIFWQIFRIFPDIFWYLNIKFHALGKKFPKWHLRNFFKMSLTS